MRSGKQRRRYLRQVRQTLWEKNPHCYHCGRKTVLPEQLPAARSDSPGPLPADTATIEHLISRYQAAQQASGDRDARLVLSCWQCNAARNRAEQQAETVRQHQRQDRYGFLLKNVGD